MYGKSVPGYTCIRQWNVDIISYPTTAPATHQVLATDVINILERSIFRQLD